MFQIDNVVFSKLFTPTDQDSVLAAVSAHHRVLFVDTGATPVLASTIKALVARGVEVHLRDHHRGEGRTPEAAEEIEQLLGKRGHIVSRSEAPGCAQLVELGEFEGAMIVADPDLDGLVAAMKATGITYPGMEADAEIFDTRPRQSAETLTALGWTAVRALATLPPYNAARPEISETAKRDLFARFMAAARGDQPARRELENAVAAYEASVIEAQRLLATQISYPCRWVALVDTVRAASFDLNTITKGLEATKVTGIKKDSGPIAGPPGNYGIQISISVAQAYQKEIDLRTLVPAGTATGPQAGLISNVPFLLHCSEKVWIETILPNLEKLNG